VFIADGKVYFSITVPAERARELEPMRAAAEKVVLAIDGVKSAMVTLTAARRAGETAPPPQQQPPGPAGHGPARPAPQRTKPMVPGVRAIVAVASGKGGVGKSTTAANLALGLSANGLAVGILDADIYGPSMPRMMGISGKPVSRDGKTLEPKESCGIEIMSIGFLIDEETPMIWRGPMVQSALMQMLRDVNWGNLDVMVVDMPP